MRSGYNFFWMNFRFFCFTISSLKCTWTAVLLYDEFACPRWDSYCGYIRQWDELEDLVWSGPLGAYYYYYLLHTFITRYCHPSCLATLEWIWSARQCTISNLPTVINRVPLLERHEPHGVPSPCDHSCIVYATVCLTVVPLFSDTTNVSTIDHSSKTDRSRTPLFHVAQYEDDIIGRELNLRKLPGRQWESCPQTLRTDATDNDKD